MTFLLRHFQTGGTWPATAAWAWRYGPSMVTDMGTFDRDVLRVEVLNEIGLHEAVLQVICGFDQAVTMTADRAATLDLVAANAGGIDTAVAIPGAIPAGIRD